MFQPSGNEGSENEAGVAGSEKVKELEDTINTLRQKQEAAQEEHNNMQ